MSAADAQFFDLPSHMDLDAIDGIRDWLLPAMDRGDVVLSGEHVERVYSNCLLMLLAAHRDAASHDVDISLIEPSPALLDAIKQLGFISHFKTLMKD